MPPCLPCKRKRLGLENELFHAFFRGKQFEFANIFVPLQCFDRAKALSVERGMAFIYRQGYLFGVDREGHYILKKCLLTLCFCFD